MLTLFIFFHIVITLLKKFLLPSWISITSVYFLLFIDFSVSNLFRSVQIWDLPLMKSSHLHILRSFGVFYAVVAIWASDLHYGVYYLIFIYILMTWMSINYLFISSYGFSLLFWSIKSAYVQCGCIEPSISISCISCIFNIYTQIYIH